MRTSSFITLALVVTLADAGGPCLRAVQHLAVPGGVEIIHHDPQRGRLHAIGSEGRMIFALDDDGNATLLGTHAFSRTQTWDATSLAIDPAGRGFGVVSWIPDPPDAAPGMAQVFNLSTGETVWQMSIGYHPDCVMFSPDGSYLYAANECEPGAVDRPGGISVLDLREIESATDFARLGYNEAVTYDFIDEHLGEGVDLGVVRLAPEHRDTPGVDIEPEYIATAPGGAWVSLQENNALAYFDLEQRRWSRVISLPALSIPFDASEQDGVRIGSGEGLALLPMPDTIDRVEIGGRAYLVLANEGEKSPGRELRLGEAIERGLIDPATVERLRAAHGDLREGGIDRLYISTIDGDLDGDGDIDLPCAQGGRSVSIIDVETGITVWNSGAQIELLTGAMFPELYNDADARSDRAGPEPEGIAVHERDGRVLLGVGLERTNAVLLYDIANPISPMLLDAVELGGGCRGPEGLCFYEHQDRLFLAVAGEEGGCLLILEVVDE